MHERRLCPHDATRAYNSHDLDFRVLVYFIEFAIRGMSQELCELALYKNIKKQIFKQKLYIKYFRIRLIICKQPDSKYKNVKETRIMSYKQ